ncbi:hypothetical protein SAMN05216236_12124 [Sedimentitalea nanhaiensis]|uniref:Uncharacterized protein n=1 Tax=Sedimentitalea nanhaiensis TaxID=999627 RepID=A0A1I7CZ49_9RHOB|nr:hypothetical protein SAMN05216236_12124 [Sedimentitalea nanhaiensis]
MRVWIQAKVNSLGLDVTVIDMSLVLGHAFPTLN